MQPMNVHSALLLSPSSKQLPLGVHGEAAAPRYVFHNILQHRQLQLRLLSMLMADHAVYMCAIRLQLQSHSTTQIQLISTRKTPSRP